MLTTTKNQYFATFNLGIIDNRNGKSLLEIAGLTCLSFAISASKLFFFNFGECSGDGKKRGQNLSSLFTERQGATSDLTLLTGWSLPES